jgi:hypothetical protein
MLLPLLYTVEFFPPGRNLALVFLVSIFLWFRSKLARQKLISPIQGVNVVPGAHWLFGHISYMIGPLEVGDKDNFDHLFVDHANEQGLSCAYYFRAYSCG